MTKLEQAHLHLREQLDWKGPSGKQQGIVTLPRDLAEAICQLLNSQACAEYEQAVHMIDSANKQNS